MMGERNACMDWTGRASRWPSSGKHVGQEFYLIQELTGSVYRSS